MAKMTLSGGHTKCVIRINAFKTRMQPNLVKDEILKRAAFIHEDDLTRDLIHEALGCLEEEYCVKVFFDDSDLIVGERRFPMVKTIERVTDKIKDVEKTLGLMGIYSFDTDDDEEEGYW